MGNIRTRDGAMRTRRAHTKSRLGCIQCKKRRIKVRGSGALFVSSFLTSS